MSTVLYLVRHAVAEDTAPSGRDADRRLTADGVRRMERAAAGLKTLGVRPRIVLASPLRRAQETAAVLQAALAPRQAVETYDPLGPGHDPAAIVRGLRAYRGVAELALVGHQPDLGELASYLLTGSPTAAAFEFKKGGVAAIEVATLPPHAPGVLLWFLSPKALRATAGD